MLLGILGLLLNITPANAIIGGVPVSSDEEISKSIVLLYGVTADKSGFECTGTILNQEYILTAAHCALDVRAMFVIFSTDAESQDKMTALLKDKTYVRNVVKVNHNIDYPNTTLGSMYPHNDIGLVRFAGGIPAGYKPVTLLNPSVMNQFVKKDTPIIASGYGIRSGDGTDSGALYKTTLDVLESYPKTVVVGRAGTSVCHGDSGGPAFVSVGGKLYQWGVASRVEDSKCSTESVYTPLTSNFYGHMETP